MVCPLNGNGLNEVYSLTLARVVSSPLSTNEAFILHKQGPSGQ